MSDWWDYERGDNILTLTTFLPGLKLDYDDVCSLHEALEGALDIMEAREMELDEIREQEARDENREVNRLRYQ